jgi:hypothetical protein
VSLSRFLKRPTLLEQTMATGGSTMATRKLEIVRDLLVEDASTQEEASACETFFRARMDSTAPVVETLVEEETVEVEPESQQVRDRRARLRRVVATLLTATAVFAVMAVARTAIARRAPRQEAVAPQAALGMVVAPKAVEALQAAGAARTEPAKQTAQAASPAPQPAVVDKPAQEAQANAVAAPTESPASEQPSDDASDEPQPDPAEGARLRKEATAQLDRGKIRDAVETARAATVADPSHATAWLLLGTALQSSGKYKDGAEAYSRCVHRANKGPIWECRAMGGR